MARRGAPSTYELLKRMSSSGKSGGGGSGLGQSGGGIAGNRGGQPVAFEISLVWMVVAAVLFVVGIVIAYNVGTRSGGGAPSTPNTPNLAGPQGAGSGGVPNTAPGVQPTPNAGSAPSRSPQVPPLAATDNNGDPRAKGFKYYVLAHPSTERAPAMVEFCRTNGLDAYLVPDDNAMLRKIVVLPGYRDSSEKNSEVIRKLEADIRRVGEKWKNSQRGNKDFSDAYPENYR